MKNSLNLLINIILCALFILFFSTIFSKRLKVMSWNSKKNTLKKRLWRRVPTVFLIIMGRGQRIPRRNFESLF